MEPLACSKDEMRGTEAWWAHVKGHHLKTFIKLHTVPSGDTKVQIQLFNVGRSTPQHLETHFNV